MPRKQLNAVERGLEALLFAGRWLMAPIYVGLLFILAAIAIKFVEELLVTMPSLLSMHERDMVLFVLGLIDLALLGSLTLMVAFAGYENFVSKMHSVRGHEDRPDWMGHIDFSGLKLKLISSIVAISAIPSGLVSRPVVTSHPDRAGQPAVAPFRNRPDPASA